MRLYKHLVYDFPEPVREDRETGRVYITPEGKVYPSVTTVLSIEGNEYLDEWRQRVGEQEADRVSALASMRGTRLHQLCEDWLCNNPSQPGMFDVEMFNAFKPCLGRIDNIRAIEKKLYSDLLEVSGTVDLIADWDGVPAIIDWKTSKWDKQRDDIHHYFHQMSAYAVAWRERTGESIKKMVIVMGIDGEPKAKVFEESPKEWLAGFVDLRKKFRQIKGY